MNRVLGSRFRVLVRRNPEFLRTVTLRERSALLVLSVVSALPVRAAIPEPVRVETGLVF